MHLVSLSEMTLYMVRGQKYEVAVLPVGSCEQHGFHLPYGTDSFEAELIAKRVCERAVELGAKVILLPTIPYGVNSNMLSFPMTIHIQPSTLNAMISDIIRSLEKHGIRKIVLFNGHGGNEFKPLLRELYGHTGAFVCIVEWWKVASDIYPQLFKETGEHSGAVETSVSLALFPHLVHMEWAAEGKVRKSRFEAIENGWVDIVRPWERLTFTGGQGNPAEASAEKGEKVISAVVERIAKFLAELSESKIDELFPYM
ncbi:MAG: creatininase family protein [Armatimonadota bacterium]|nr:creatininase family protein [Armatimonadota bacterium]MCX7776749.1 creatininase family protein [Armatimonadota bacterium]MDW8024547.1 creatininase family protein [Armatimonadota bacterium]